MKLYFYKNMDQLIPTEPCVWDDDDAEMLGPPKRLKNFENALSLVLNGMMLLWLLWLILFAKPENLWGILAYLLIFLLVIPVSAFCDALGFWLLGKRIQFIILFPSNPQSAGRATMSFMVMPSYDAFKRWQLLFGSLFPTLLFTAAPVLAAVFLPDWRPWLLTLAVFFIFCNARWAFTTVYTVARLPKDAVIVRSIPFRIKDPGKPFIHHRLFLSEDHTAVCHETYSWFDNKLTVIPPFETAETLEAKQKLAEEFHAEYTVYEQK